MTGAAAKAGIENQREESDKGESEDGEREGKEKQGQRVETQQRQEKGNDRMLSMQPVGTLNQHACCQPYCTWSPGVRLAHI